MNHRSLSCKVTFTLGVVLVGLLPALRANPITLTLDLNSLSTGSFTTPLSVDGFTLTPNLGPSSIPEIVNVGGSNVLESSSNGTAQGADTFLTRVGGGSFTLVSVDLASLGTVDGLYGVAIASTTNGHDYVWGGSYFSGNPGYQGTLTNSFTLENVAGAFTNVSVIDFDPVSDGGKYAIKDIVVSYNPSTVPDAGSSLALLGGALLLLAACGRKQRLA